MSDSKDFDATIQGLNLGDLDRETPEGTLVACSAWEVLLPDAAEGLLSETEQEALDRHVLTCAGCAWELADAQRGAAWLALLKGHAPEPPNTLLRSILEKTSGADQVAPMISVAPIAAAVPVVGVRPAMPRAEALPAPTLLPAQAAKGLWQQLESWLGFGEGLASALQPRLAMTSAMAFFSICLTSNLLGISVRNLHAESLRPAGLQRTVADKSALLVRSFEGIRVVYRVESRVNEWRTASAAQAESPLVLNR